MAIKLARSLKNKHILITAGPTWVPIDSVRVISNTATGNTGFLLAEKLSKEGAKVTLLLGPCEACCLSKKIRLIRFKFFDELKGIVKKELKKSRYEFIIHSAAISDFRPAKASKGKLCSGIAHDLRLVALPKIAKDIRRAAPKSWLVLFKLESGILDKTLIGRARHALLKIKADLIIANRIQPNYKAFILNREKVFCKVDSKQELVAGLIKILKRVKL